MRKQKTDDVDQLWFEKHVGPAVNRFDAVHSPPIPGLNELEQRVKRHKQDVKRMLWKELALFWLTAIFVLSSMLWLLDNSRMWFAVVQTVFAAGGIGYVSMIFGRRMGHKWKN
ncbi:YxlC family protein [Paenibacillus alkaliterrae]|uniref:YxlC family protein n=1 Tax=Paenibacillus alkaliterrae TaxID=320909 RepID=UPI001F395AB9|nr:YxlC family protein [Paenibacillus alkaliterrae]MCF2939068.1 YxlC family protein [Paenibacillus alkaliterrae]